MYIDLLRSLQDPTPRAPGHHIKLGEIARGGTIIPVGSRPWFPADEWADWSVVSQRETTVRICLVAATPPGKGAFRRLIQGIMGEGLVPCVIDPSASMYAILQHYGWRDEMIGQTIETAEWRVWP